MYKNYIKRLIDIILSFCGLIILSPIILLIAILIKLDSKGPIFFKQQRVKKDKKLFTMYKFRTMKTTAPKDTPTQLLQNPEQYISRVGKVLRKSSLDELIQIIHILEGSMSIIGPRPALYNQDDLIAERDKYGANDIKPGLTGWAQINGRDELPIEVKAKLDGYYTTHLSFLLDIRCFWGTIKSVLVRDGVVEGASTTLEVEPLDLTTINKQQNTQKSAEKSH